MEHFQKNGEKGHVKLLISTPLVMMITRLQLRRSEPKHAVGWTRTKNHTLPQQCALMRHSLAKIATGVGLIQGKQEE